MVFRRQNREQLTGFIPCKSVGKAVEVSASSIPENSHSHRGFSPVDVRHTENERNRFNGFVWRVQISCCEKKTVKTVQSFGMVR